MKKLILGILFMGLSYQAVASETCYQVSQDPDVWSRTPELICFVAKDNSTATTIKLVIDELINKRVVAQFAYDYLSGVRCGPNCIGKIYGVANPENSSFNNLKISINGVRSPAGEESGTISIGETKYYYRN